MTGALPNLPCTDFTWRAPEIVQDAIIWHPCGYRSKNPDHVARLYCDRCEITWDASKARKL